jgi:hypothetical protein
LKETAASVFYIHNPEDNNPKLMWVKQVGRKREREASWLRPGHRPGCRWKFNINIDIEEIRQNDLN